MKQYNNIIFVGAGGTNGYVIPHIARIVSEMPAAPNILIFDNDIVEPRNINRQNFTANDVGKFKAQALAERYSAAFGVQIIFVNERFVPANLYEYLKDSMLITRPGIRGDNNLLIEAVDNLKTRMQIHQQYDQRNYSYSSHTDWISNGNDKDFGQVVFYAQGTADRRSVVTAFPEIFTEQAITREAEEDHARENCANNVVSQPQYLATNLMCATLTTTLVYHLLMGSEFPDYDIVYFNIYGQVNYVKRGHSIIEQPILTPDETNRLLSALESL